MCVLAWRINAPAAVSETVVSTVPFFDQPLAVSEHRRFLWLLSEPAATAIFYRATHTARTGRGVDPNNADLRLAWYHY